MIFEASVYPIPFWILNNLNNGKQINRKNKNNSTPTNNQNKMVLPAGFNHKKYSIKSVNKKYNNPIPIKKITPFIS